MKAEEVNINLLAQKVQELPTQTIVMLVEEMNKISKKSKKAPLKSGQMFFSDWCKAIAKALTTPSKKELISKYRLA